MKYAIKYTEFISHTKGEIRLSETREEFAAKMAENYCKQFNKKKTAKVLEYFASDAGAYHAVRNILEDIKTDNFKDVLDVFNRCYPEASQDWKSALKCGLIVTAGKKVGNYSNGEYIFNSPIAQELRTAGLNGPIEKIIALYELKVATGCENTNTLNGLIDQSIESINKQTSLNL